MLEHKSVPCKIQENPQESEGKRDGKQSGSHVTQSCSGPWARGWGEAVSCAWNPGCWHRPSAWAMGGAPTCRRQGAGHEAPALIRTLSARRLAQDTGSVSVSMQTPGGKRVRPGASPGAETQIYDIHVV